LIKIDDEFMASLGKFRIIWANGSTFNIISLSISYFSLVIPSRLAPEVTFYFFTIWNNHC
jgi:hypothetical protein